MVDGNSEPSPRLGDSEAEGGGSVETTEQGGSSIDADGEKIQVGGTATISLTGGQVDEVTVRDLWTDWCIEGVQKDGATFFNEVTNAGQCRFEWSTIQGSVSVSITVALPKWYLGGAFGIGVTGSNSGDSAETAVSVSIEEGTGDHDYVVETVGSGLERPWGITFLPNDSRMLVTERPGRLNIVDRNSGNVTVVSNTPEVYANGQGGMLDVALHPQFPNKSWVYLTYSASDSNGNSATHLGRGKIDLQQGEFSVFEQLHVAEPFVDSNGHFGSRVTFDGDGMLYQTSGDRRNKNFGPDHVSQDTSNELGATLRLNPDGSIPGDNPLVDEDGTADAIFSYGHRNPQGMTVHPDTGDIWQSEHGESDGDEINIVERGGNFGWPVASEACRYDTGEPIGDSHDERDDIVNPVYYWECGTGGYPPAGATFYDGTAFPNWEGDLFVGNLAKQFLGRFAVEGRNVVQLDPLLADRNWRIRDVEVAPDDGHLYVAVDGIDAPLVRLKPA